MGLMKLLARKVHIQKTLTLRELRTYNLDTWHQQSLGRASIRGKAGT